MVANIMLHSTASVVSVLYYLTVLSILNISCLWVLQRQSINKNQDYYYDYDDDYYWLAACMEADTNTFLIHCIYTV